jgi:uncharacterized membrane protein YgaE (UPF0421/DUF939 family)
MASGAMTGGTMARKSKYTGLGVALGAGLGVAVGVMSGHVAVWLAIGVAIGVAIGMSLRERANGCPQCAAVHRSHETKN